MDTNWLRVLLLAGVLLLDTARAECTAAAVTSCLANVMQSGALTKLQSFDASTTSDSLKTNCDALKQSMDCLKAVIKDCTESQRTQLTAAVPDMDTIYKGFCNKATTCMAKRNTCFVADPALNAYISTGPIDFNTSFCPALITLARCLKETMPYKCHLVKMVQLGTHRLQLATNFCHEQNCPALQTCRRTFDTSGPVILDSKTCTLFSNYSRCVTGAVASCSNIQSPEREPSPTKVSELVAKVCSLIADGKNLYNCGSLNACISTFFSTQDPFSPQHLCQTFQGVLGCAMKKASVCIGNTPAVTNFTTYGNKLALEGAALGCAAPDLYTASCPQLLTCKFSLASLAAPNPSFGTVCMAVQGFQTCASNAAKTCNLTEPPATRKRPRMDKMTDITRDMCNAMQNKKVTTCKEYLECTGGPRVKRPMSDGELITADSWCPSTVYALECALYFSETCSVTEDLKEKLRVIYKRLLDEGCENIFNFQPQVTAGAQPLVCVSLVSLLFLALFLTMARLV